MFINCYFLDFVFWNWDASFLQNLRAVDKIFFIANGASLTNTVLSSSHFWNLDFSCLKFLHWVILLLWNYANFFIYFIRWHVLLRFMYLDLHLWFSSSFCRLFYLFIEFLHWWLLDSNITFLTWWRTILVISLIDNAIENSRLSSF